MQTKIKKLICRPQGETYNLSIEIESEVLREYGFKVGDCVNLEISENKIVITKDHQTKIISLFSRKNPHFDKLVESFDLTPSKNG